MQELNGKIPEIRYKQGGVTFFPDRLLPATHLHEYLINRQSCLDEGEQMLPVLSVKGYSVIEG